MAGWSATATAVRLPARCRGIPPSRGLLTRAAADVSLGYLGGWQSTKPVPTVVLAARTGVASSIVEFVSDATAQNLCWDKARPLWLRFSVGAARMRDHFCCLFHRAILLWPHPRPQSSRARVNGHSDGEPGVKSKDEFPRPDVRSQLRGYLASWCVAGSTGGAFCCLAGVGRLLVGRRRRVGARTTAAQSTHDGRLLPENCHPETSGARRPGAHSDRDRLVA